MLCSRRPRKLFKLLAGSAFLAFSAIGFADLPVYQLRFGVSDFDQKWEGLYDYNFGKYYCVPTSYANIFRYLDDNGLDGMSWIAHHTSPNYESSIRDELIRLGNWMDTDPEEGTSVEGAFDYAVEHLADRAPNTLLYSWFYGPDWNWGTARIQRALASGSMVNLFYGYYKRGSLLGQTVWARDGGHAVTAVGFDYRNPIDKWLIVNDPWTEDIDISQSQMMYEEKQTKNITLNVWPGGEVTHARYTMSTGENNDERKVIDSMHQIMPIYVGWNDTIVAEARAQRVSRSPKSQSKDGREGKYHGDGSVRVVIPWQPSEQMGVVPKEFRFKPREDMVDWMLAVGEMSAYYITDLGRIFHVDMLSGEHKLLHVIKGAKKLVEGGTTLDLFVLVSGKKNDQIVMLDRDSNRMMTRNLEGRAVGFEYNPLTGGPAVLDESLDKMFSFSEDLTSIMPSYVAKVEDGPGEVIFKIDHQSGDVLLARRGATSFTRFSQRFGTDLPTRQTPRMQHGITTLAPTENGLLVIQDGQRLFTVDRFGVERVTQLTGLVATGEIKMTRSHVAANFELMKGHAWRNLDPLTD